MVATREISGPSAKWNIVVSFPKGGSTDFTARMLAQEVHRISGQTTRVENCPGHYGIDLAHYLVGDISRVTGLSRTRIRNRPVPQARSTFESASMGAPTASVDTNDVSSLLVEFADGDMIGTIEISRTTVPRKSHCCLEIDATRAAIVFHYEHMNELQVCGAGTNGPGLTRVVIGPEPNGGFFWSLGGLGIGFAETVVLQMRGFLRAIAGQSVVNLEFIDGLRAQEVIHVAMMPIRTGTWEQVE